MRALLAIALITITTPCIAQSMDVRSFDDGFALGQLSAQQSQPKLVVPVPEYHPPGYPFENVPTPPAPIKTQAKTTK